MSSCIISFQLNYATKTILELKPRNKDADSNTKGSSKGGNGISRLDIVVTRHKFSVDEPS